MLSLVDSCRNLCHRQATVAPLFVVRICRACYKSIHNTMSCWGIRTLVLYSWCSVLGRVNHGNEHCRMCRANSRSMAPPHRVSLLGAIFSCWMKSRHIILPFGIPTSATFGSFPSLVALNGPKTSTDAVRGCGKSASMTRQKAASTARDCPLPIALAMPSIISRMLQPDQPRGIACRFRVYSFG